MYIKRLLAPLVLSSSLAVVFLILPGLLGGEPLAAQTTAGVRFVATTGTDVGGCANPASPCRTVQYAVDVATPGDEIRVATGVYTNVLQRAGGRQVVSISKSLVIRGGYNSRNWAATDPAAATATILNANGRGRVISISGPVTVGLERLGITRGDATGLGGGPRGEDAGGGIYAVTATVWINNSWIAGNKADDGGGIYLAQSEAKLNANSIVSNTARLNGGGIYISHSPAAVLNKSTVAKNAAGRNGGGLSLDHSAALLDGNAISENQALYGGGLHLHSSPARLFGNLIRSNRATAEAGKAATYDAGGLALSYSTATLDNNLIADNSAADRGAGVFVWASRLHFRHTTLVANKGGDGSGIHVLGSPEAPSDVLLENSILVGHAVGVTVTKGSTVTLEATLWGAGSWANGVDVGGSALVFTGTINIWEEPRFVNPPAGNYHIRPTSPAVDAGVDVGVRSDIDGEHRPFGAAPDLGADEVPLSIAGPSSGSNFVYTDTRGITLAIEIPAEAVTRTTRLVFTPVITPEEPISPNLRFGGRAFDLDAYWDDTPRTDFIFRRGVTITIQYSDTDVAEINESTLRLYYWNAAANAWIDAATTCTPPSRYRRNPARNVLQVPICHLSRYSMQGTHPGTSLYLPLLLRNEP